jgi:nucleoside-diphosphate-sugar epimerase
MTNLCRVGPTSYHSKTSKLTRRSGIGGFIHVAAPISESADVELGISIAVKGALNALEACAKTPSCKRFVFTSSSVAVTLPHTDVEFSVDETTYNDETLKLAREKGAGAGLLGYVAMKTESEKQVWKWMQENKPGFTINSIVSRVSIILVIDNADCGSYPI